MAIHGVSGHGVVKYGGMVGLENRRLAKDEGRYYIYNIL